ncbi:hypothetical protein RCL_jg20389.t1 [Rhizophagus clarus]|uniref:Uncharacterized protein n=1 Tax=Rhizophagus clarus TaxID=94130 RepID=A0A8H3KZR2_9GLOM|nr:hypothetical protein RCL_jg20389.t1 [Rhizophagus clarus]
MKFCNMNLSTLFFVFFITLNVLLVPALSAPLRLVKRLKSNVSGSGPSCCTNDPNIGCPSLLEAEKNIA